MDLLLRKGGEEGAECSPVSKMPLHHCFLSLARSRRGTSRDLAVQREIAASFIGRLDCDAVFQRFLQEETLS